MNRLHPASWVRPSAILSGDVRNPPLRVLGTPSFSNDYAQAVDRPTRANAELVAGNHSLALPALAVSRLYGRFPR